MDERRKERTRENVCEKRREERRSVEKRHLGLREDSRPHRGSLFWRICVVPQEDLTMVLPWTGEQVVLVEVLDGQ